MKTFLMCDPRYFEVSYVINPWMAGNQGRENKELATKQWKNLHDILSSKASIRLIEPVAGLPDMVFTAILLWASILPINIGLFSN